MPTSIDRFRSAVQLLTRDKVHGAVRYPAELRAAAVALARPRVRDGHAVRAIAWDLGVADPTLAGGCASGRRRSSGQWSSDPMTSA